jgi:hypothetical protein
MDAQNAHPPESRPPTVNDLLVICRSLNAQGVAYMVVGGFAVNQHGYTRATMDIDLLIEDSLENQAKVKRALEILPDKAVRELGDDDLRNWVVVRVCDEVVVDLMTMACGQSYRDGESEIEIHSIRGVPIPFASARLLLRTKQTHRDKDAEDRLFLEAKIASKNP